MLAVGLASDGMLQIEGTLCGFLTASALSSPTYDFRKNAASGSFPSSLEDLLGDPVSHLLAVFQRCPGISDRFAFVGSQF